MRAVLHPSTLAGLRVSSGEQDSTQSERIQRSYERLKMRVGSRRSTPKASLRWHPVGSRLFPWDGRQAKERVEIHYA